MTHYADGGDRRGTLYSLLTENMAICYIVYLYTTHTGDKPGRMVYKNVVDKNKQQFCLYIEFVYIQCTYMSFNIARMKGRV